MAKAQTPKWSLHETGGKLYLYAADIVERERLDSTGRYTHAPETARPLSKRDALQLGAYLVAYAAR